ncbi:unnamed protein product [Anisakis simplex]|uniref:MFS domain-containing protein n=1 Tax=Anisakis simplex TaxID=6269 RepID=A0A0M3KFV2_ANISI|nr:unnamed protein product [Anisakis simplex]
MARPSLEKDENFDKERPEGKPRIGFFVYMLCFMAVIGGFLFGYDTAVVSAVLLYIPEAPGLKPMNNQWKQLIVSITPGMAALGALFAAPSSDKFGRKKIVITSSFVFTIGAIICAASVSRAMLFVGRIFLGLAIGRISIRLYHKWYCRVHILILYCLLFEL